MEDMPSNCYQYDSGLYAVRHDPFAYFGHVQNDKLECNRVVPAGPQADLMITDLASVSSASNFMWLTPNLCDDMHNCSVSSGDQYLSQTIPRILNSDVFLTRKAALFLTWDEGRINNSTNIPAIWAGPPIRNNFTSAIRHDHYSFIKTIEMAWHLPFLTSNDAQSSTMTEFFMGPRLGLSYYPIHPQPNETVNFWGRATGGSSPYTFEWSFGDGRIDTGAMTTHQYRATGSYEVAMSVTDAFNTTALSVTTIIVSHVPISQVRPSFLSWLLGVIPTTITAASTLITVAGGLLVGRFLGRKKTRHP